MSIDVSRKESSRLVEILTWQVLFNVCANMVTVDSVAITD